jgi:hypothetical protein
VKPRAAGLSVTRKATSLWSHSGGAERCGSLRCGTRARVAQEHVWHKKGISGSMWRTHSRGWGDEGMRATGRLLIAGLCCVSSTSCVWHPRYPGAWAPRERVAPGLCPDVAGTYEDAGESASKSPEPRRLSSILLIGHPVQAPSATTVELRQPDADTLEVLARDGPEVIAQRVFSRAAGGFSWNSKRLRLSYGLRGIAGEGFALGGCWLRIYLARNSDGWLVVRHRAEEAGLVYIIPVLGSTSGWCRFPPAGDAGSGAPPGRDAEPPG